MSSHKRTGSSAGITSHEPAAKRHDSEVKSPRTSIRDASQALINAIERARTEMDVKAAETAFPPEYVYMVVTQSSSEDPGEPGITTFSGEGVWKVFATATDACNFVLNFAGLTEYDINGHTDLQIGRGKDGFPWCVWRTEKRHLIMQVRVLKKEVESAAYEPQWRWQGDVPSHECPCFDRIEPL